MDLNEWQDFLRKQMERLDQAWAALDGVWQYTPSDQSPEIGDHADRFYQSYWDVFHAAVQGSTMVELERPVSDAITTAETHVTDAWKSVVAERIRRLEQEILRATIEITSPLSGTRKILRQAKEIQENAGKLASADQLLQAVEEFKSCLEQCESAEAELDDALRAQRRFTWTKVAVVATTAATLFALGGIVF